MATQAATEKMTSCTRYDIDDSILAVKAINTITGASRIQIPATTRTVVTPLSLAGMILTS
jgi:hypothetical protein